MQTIAVFNTRGGSGKSAAVTFTADFLATLFKKRVLVVDLDPQQSSSTAILGEERLYEAFGRKKSLPLLMQRTLEEEIAPNAVMAHTIERPKHCGRKGVVYLGPLLVLACERESWLNLNDALCNGHSSRRARTDDLLRRMLVTVNGEFDICLIDFPGHEVGPIARAGLRAADWWLFPCVPDRAGIRDIEGPVRAIKEAYRGCSRQIKGLGTLVSICQPATSSEYRQAYQTLKVAGEDGVIPRLFNNRARMLNWVGARSALDDTLWDESTTLAQKYKEKALSEAVRALAKEMLQRLDMSSEEARIKTGLLDGLNSALRRVFVGSRTK